MPDVVLGYSRDQDGHSYCPQRVGWDREHMGGAAEKHRGAMPRKSVVELAKERARDWCSRQRNCIHKVRRVTESMVSAATCHQMLPPAPISH